MGRDLTGFGRTYITIGFQSTLPAWGETLGGRAAIHGGGGFQSTLPAWGETALTLSVCFWPQHFNPLSPHGERLCCPTPPWMGWNFNPLSPHGERPGSGARDADGALISIHSPRMGRDYIVKIDTDTQALFQSTLPAWGETERGRLLRARQGFQSTLPAWGETPRAENPFPSPQISIHSPRMGRDIAAEEIQKAVKRFQSTLPAWGETTPG